MHTVVAPGKEGLGRIIGKSPMEILEAVGFKKQSIESNIHSRGTRYLLVLIPITKVCKFVSHVIYFFADAGVSE